eukprot:TRINITY_DN54490_c0_g1_i1.p2 TRINITY_DN54490_c0_g1~~TRINITY_DN54490_c0_g1_i1.p2  ORF type:complete len:150 (+),score=26.94 TRINITY_DN54490_c0_g1_i1:89-538(+)
MLQSSKKVRSPSVGSDTSTQRRTAPCTPTSSQKQLPRPGTGQRVCRPGGASALAMHATLAQMAAQLRHSKACKQKLQRMQAEGENELVCLEQEREIWRGETERLQLQTQVSGDSAPAPESSSRIRLSDPKSPEPLHSPMRARAPQLGRS